MPRNVAYDNYPLHSEFWAPCRLLTIAGPTGQFRRAVVTATSVHMYRCGTYTLYSSQDSSSVALCNVTKIDDQPPLQMIPKVIGKLLPWRTRNDRAKKEQDRKGEKIDERQLQLIKYAKLEIQESSLTARQSRNTRKRAQRPLATRRFKEGPRK